MNIILIHTKNGIKYAKVIQDYILSQGINCYLSRRKSIKQVITDNNLKPNNTLIYSRIAGKYTNEKLAKIEAMGYKIINSTSTLELTSNKYKANLHAAQKKLPIADTYKINKTNFAEIKKLLKKYKILVLKPIHSQGQGIFCHKIQDNLSAKELKAKIKEVPGEEIQVQGFIDYQKLIRVIVIGYKVVADSYTYDIPDQGWKCSVCLNPRIKKYEPSDDRLKDLAEKTAKAFEAEINFIDFFEDKKGKFILNEINTACNLIRHEQVTGVDIHKYIGDFLIKKLKKL
jgi:glutathione synthase/RimK-type ligase-like ATP-grasp enzyme